MQKSKLNNSYLGHDVIFPALLFLLPMQVVIPPLAVLGVGWILVLVEFGQGHSDVVQWFSSAHLIVYVCMFKYIYS